jgi:hypothetical protein
VVQDSLGFIVLCGGALAAIAQWIIRPLYHAIRDTSRGVRYVKAEMENNSGKTMRDAIDRLEEVNLLFAERLGVDIPPHLLPQSKKGTHPQ